MGIAIIDKINAEQTAGLAKKGFPEFRAGDVVRVSVRIKEDTLEALDKLLDGLRLVAGGLVRGM